MGLLSALNPSAFDPQRPWMQGANPPPQMGGGMGPVSNNEFAQMQGGMPGAFSNNPAFQQQLAAIMGGQGPGMQPPQFTPPLSPVGAAPMGGAGMRGGQMPTTGMGVGGLGGMSGNNNINAVSDLIRRLKMGG